MAPTIFKVKLSLWETDIGNAGSVAGATLAKKRQKIVKTEHYKVSENRSSPHCAQATWATVRAARAGAGDLAAGSTTPVSVLSQYDSSDNESGDEDEGLNEEKVADDDIIFDGLDDEEQAKGGAGARAKGAAYLGPNEEAGATIERTEVQKTTDNEINEDGQAWKGGHEIDKAMAGKVEKDNEAEKGGHGLCHGMAGLEAAMAVPGSTAARFVERAQDNQATAEEVATEHEAVGCSILYDQAGALSKALGPKATERTYLAMLNAEGISWCCMGCSGGQRPQAGPVTSGGGLSRSRGRCGRAQASPTFGCSRSRMTNSSSSSSSHKYCSATRPGIMKTRQTLSTIAPRLPWTQEDQAGHQRAGASLRQQREG
jgi:hypothetical protein